MGSEIIYRYFLSLDASQRSRIDRLYELYADWNARINVISRKDIEQMYVRHVLHSLAIAKVHAFGAGETVMDLGCGGGFPGIPLAILFPDTSFKLVDSIGKKIKVVEGVSDALGLTNVETFHARAEELSFGVDHVVSRAVTDLAPFMKWCWGKIRSGGGVFYLKGGDLDDEIKKGISGLAGVGRVEQIPVSAFFDDPFFETKKVLCIDKR